MNVDLDWGLRLTGLGLPPPLTFESTDPLNTISGSVSFQPTGENFAGVSLDAIFAQMSPGGNNIILNYSGGDLLAFLGLDTFGVEQFATADIFFATSDPSVSARYDRSASNGSYRVSYDFQPFVQVPEPSTALLFAFGLAGLGFMTRRRRKAGTA